MVLAPAVAFLGLILAGRAGADVGGNPLSWLTSYAAIALAVTGGIRIGNGLRTGAARGRRGWMAAIGGGLTPLAAFGGLVLPTQAGLGLLAFAWAALGAADSLAAARGLLPAWYGRLRIAMTFGAVAVLVAALLLSPG
jgi:hypothetical protein